MPRNSVRTLFLCIRRLRRLDCNFTLPYIVNLDHVSGHMADNIHEWFIRFMVDAILSLLQKATLVIHET